jgi:hypothetical protein
MKFQAYSCLRNQVKEMDHTALKSRHGLPLLAELWKKMQQFARFDDI